MRVRPAKPSSIRLAPLNERRGDALSDEDAVEGATEMALHVLRNNLRGDETSSGISNRVSRRSGVRSVCCFGAPWTVQSCRVARRSRPGLIQTQIQPKICLRMVCETWSTPAACSLTTKQAFLQAWVIASFWKGPMIPWDPTRRTSSGPLLWRLVKRGLRRKPATGPRRERTYLQPALQRGCSISHHKTAIVPANAGTHNHRWVW